MRPLSFQFFANFAVLGCVLPYLTVYLVEGRGMTETQAGLLYGVHGLSVLVTPVLLTLFADTRLTNRKLLAGCFAVAAVGLAGMLLGPGIAAIVAGYFVFRFAFSPIMSLEDGLAFAEQHADTQAGRTPRPYQATRVWGTYGFLGGTAAIYALLHFGWPIGVAIGSATVWCVLGVLNATRLPAFPEAKAEVRRPDARLPTTDALRRLTRPRLLGFCAAMLLLFFAASSYYAFYPLWMVQTVDIDEQWIGPIIAIGVVLEIAPILGFGWLARRVGLRRLILLSVACMCVRFLWIAADASVFTAIANQTLHGMMVLLVHVIPPVYLNHHAEPRYRSSIQGVYSMGVIGVGQLVGPAIAGVIASESLPWVFVYAAGLCVAAGVLMFLSVDRQGDRTIAD